MSTPSIAAVLQASPGREAEPVTRARSRDLRLDFFRGSALLLIFIDHVAGNGLALFTLQRLGFADAAEVFVFIAGMAGVFAYRSTLLNKGLAAGAAAIMLRIRLLYMTHLLMVGGVLLFAMAALLSGSGFDVIAKLGLQPLLDDPAAAITRLPVLAFLPHYLDILPLYVVLLATLPLIILGQRRHLLLPIAGAAAAYALVQAFGLTLPNLGHAGGWYLNPFAWVLLFVLGATAAELSIRDGWRKLPRPLVAAITFAAAAYVGFAFLQAAPWAFGEASTLAFEVTFESNKSMLSWHRLLDILAKAWLVAVLVPRQAAFMTSGIGGAVSRAGRHSLPVFVFGTFLSLAASVLLHETGGGAPWQVLVNAGGIAALLGLAFAIDARGRSGWTAAPALRLPAGRSGFSAS